MNSHQRRLARRYWPYQYQFGIDDWKYNLTMIDWCKEHFGPMYKDRWHYRYIGYDPEETIFWFHDKRDAVWFSMKWAGNEEYI